MKLTIACSGFVDPNAGSVASANDLLLEQLLRLGHRIDFFTKPSFVYPQRHMDHEGFRMVDVTNQWTDMLRQRIERVRWAKPLHVPAGMLDSMCYTAGIARAIKRAHASRRYDLVLYLGTNAFGRLRNVPTVSWLQGPAGTDARSVFRRRDEIQALSGYRSYTRLLLLATLRNAIGMPRYGKSDCLIVGSDWSKNYMCQKLSWPGHRIHALPYPINLDAFSVKDVASPTHEPVRVLWLGRTVPRKRLDLLLDAADRAIRDGLDMSLEVVGGFSFAPGYEKLISRFPYPDRLTYRSTIPRGEVPHLLRHVDVLCQPSEEENFGSSVAEALSCGTPVIVGATNGTGDYICPRSTRLADYRPETLAAAFIDYGTRKRRGTMGDPQLSRQVAERWFDPERVAGRLEAILHEIVAKRSNGRAIDVALR